MKVNILGSGIIPYVGVLAPMRDVELGEKEIRGLLNFKNLRVYEKSTGYLISKLNVDKIFNKNKPEPKSTTPVVEKKVEPVKKEEYVAPKLAIVVDEPVKVEETPVNEDEVIATIDDSEGIGDVDIEATETEESSEETSDDKYNFKKKNKKRH